MEAEIRWYGAFARHVFDSVINIESFQVRYPLPYP